MMLQGTSWGPHEMFTKVVYLDTCSEHVVIFKI